MAEEPKSRREHIFEMLCNPTPEQLKILSGARDPDKLAGLLSKWLGLDPDEAARVLELLRDVAALRGKMLEPPEPPAVDPEVEDLTERFGLDKIAQSLGLLRADPETEKRWEQLLHHMTHARLDEVQYVRLVTTPTNNPPFRYDPVLGIGGNFNKWISIQPPSEIHAAQGVGKLVRRYLKEGGVGSPRHLRDLVRAHKDKPNN
jgi:hypothetical protein